MQKASPHSPASSASLRVPGDSGLSHQKPQEGGHKPFDLSMIGKTGKRRDDLFEKHHDLPPVLSSVKNYKEPYKNDPDEYMAELRHDIKFYMHK